MLTIKILGSGCANCKRLEQVTRDMVTAKGLQAEIIKVTDYADIMVINEKLVSFGRIPSPGELEAWLVEAAQSA